MRNMIIEGKTAELQALLEMWAHDMNILESGEVIVVKLSINNSSTVMSDAVEESLDMHPHAFFSQKRLVQLGMDPIKATRASNAIEYSNMVWRSVGADRRRTCLHNTARSYIAALTSLKKIRNIGVDTAREIVKAIGKTGIELPE